MKQKKKKLSLDGYFDTLLYLESTIEESVISFVMEFDEFQGDHDTLNFEAKIFSLWIITLAIPSDDNKRLFHQRYCKRLKMPDIAIQDFYKEMRNRYQKYYFAYNKWIKSPESSDVIGNIIAEILINQKSDFSPKESIPKTNELLKINMHQLFVLAYERTITLINELKKEFRLPK